MDNIYIAPSISDNPKSSAVIEQIRDYCSRTKDLTSKPVYVLAAALGTSFTYSVDSLVVLVPGYKVMLINNDPDPDTFEDFCDDFIEDLGYLSEKYGYKEKIGRPRQWKEKNVSIIRSNEGIRWDDYRLSSREDERIGELLISLLIGSINDIDRVGIDQPEDPIQKIKKNIVLFDSDQIGFLYSLPKTQNKITLIQGLSGTGKTELLLHKLKDIYVNETDSKIFFTCHNRTLANGLRNRIPHFFNFMKVEKQIDWNSRLWVNRAWGSSSDKNSGLYSYICSFYDIDFVRWSFGVDYDTICERALEKINQLREQLGDRFEFAFDYIFVDERQDFPQVFFDLCCKITKKQVFAAGDDFQNIYYISDEPRHHFDIVLNRCYRTDPRTLMFAHAIGLGLFDKKKLRWFKEDDWRNLGYSYHQVKNVVHLKREPIKRFDDLDCDAPSMYLLQKTIDGEAILNVIRQIRSDFPSVRAEDIAIVAIDNDSRMFDILNEVYFKVIEEFQWEVNRAYETKHQVDGALYLTNSNNIKGLEFPFVICFSHKISGEHNYRNVLYTMLTRSFIRSYFIVGSGENLLPQENGLKIINEKNYIETTMPTQEEIQKIDSELLLYQTEQRQTPQSILNAVFDELHISSRITKAKLSRALRESSVDLMDKAEVRSFIKNNVSYY